MTDQPPPRYTIDHDKFGVPYVCSDDGIIASAYATSYSPESAAEDEANMQRVADALNTADARDADYQALFAAYSGLKADFQAVFAAYTESRQHTDSAIDALKDEHADLSADRDHLVTQLAAVHSELARVTAQPDTLRAALIETLGYVPAAMRDKLVKMLGYDFEPEEVEK